jgi:hypothetical protein
MEFSSSVSFITICFRQNKKLAIQPNSHDMGKFTALIGHLSLNRTVIEWFHSHTSHDPRNRCEGKTSLVRNSKTRPFQVRKSRPPENSKSPQSMRHPSYICIIVKVTEDRWNGHNVGRNVRASNFNREKSCFGGPALSAVNYARNFYNFLTDTIDNKKRKRRHRQFSRPFYSPCSALDEEKCSVN